MSERIGGSESSQPASAPVVSVVVPARNAERTIAETLDALRAQDLDAPFEVVVVDDGSTDATAQVADRDDVTLVRREQASGASVARNAGVEASSGEVLAFTDADCVPEADWLRHGLDAVGRADLIQGSVTPPVGSVVMPFDHTLWVGSRSSLFETANLFVTREAFEGAGGFEELTDTRGGRPFGEDAWLGWRLIRRGARYEFAPRAAVRHLVIPRGARAFVAERWRRRHFPRLVRTIPEMRSALLFGHVFLDRRTAAADLAVLAGVLALVLGTPWLAAGALPYLAMLIRGAAGWRKRAPQVAAVHLAADVVGFAALVFGSGRYRSLVI